MWLQHKPIYVSNSTAPKNEISKLQKQQLFGEESELLRHIYAYHFSGI